MEIIKAKILGFCMGVKKAVETARKALESPDVKDGSVRVYTLGPLIHNPSLLRELEEQWLGVLEDDFSFLDEKSVVIIRAHGTTAAVLRRLESTGARVLDATCPRVHLSQKRAGEWSAKGYKVFIAGDKRHGEVISIAGFALGDVEVLESRTDALQCDVPANSILIAQTTFSIDEFRAISSCLKEKNPDIIVFDSICPATKERQNALEDILGQTQGILVVGGRNSANTRRLYETALLRCKHSALIENADEIPQEYFSFSSVGITAGASTPDSVIDAVEQKLHEKGL